MPPFYSREEAFAVTAPEPNPSSVALAQQNGDGTNGHALSPANGQSNPGPTSGNTPSSSKAEPSHAHHCAPEIKVQNNAEHNAVKEPLPETSRLSSKASPDSTTLQIEDTQKNSSNGNFNPNAYGNPMVPKGDPKLNGGWGNRRTSKPAPKFVKSSSKPRWPKNRDMKPVPEESENLTKEETKAQLIANGWGTEMISNPEDPNYDVKKLIGWEGNWMPPPEDWSCRPEFAHRNLRETLEKWMDGHPREFPFLSDYLEKPEFATLVAGNQIVDRPLIVTFFKGEGPHREGALAARDQANAQICEKELASYQLLIKDDPVFMCQELVPRNWIPSQIEGMPLANFWSDLQQSRKPDTVSDCGLEGSIPFWHFVGHVQKELGFFIPQLKHPEVVAVVDEHGYKDVQKHPTANEEIQKRRKRHEENVRKTQAMRAAPSPAPLVNYKGPTPVYNVVPNLYLRPVNATDVEGILEIYNHYVLDTISAPEFYCRTKPDMIDRINTITLAGLPFIVAVAKGSIPKGPISYIKERIIGFAFLLEPHEPSSMCRFSMNLEIFVHPGYLRKGVAKCLMDRLISTVCTGYKRRGGYEWINHGTYLKDDAERRVKSIVAHFPHEHRPQNLVTKDDKREPENTQWMTAFLKTFGFARRGHLTKMGYKHGKIVDVTLYQHITSEPMDPNHRPTCGP